MAVVHCRRPAAAAQSHPEERAASATHLDETIVGSQGKFRQDHAEVRVMEQRVAVRRARMRPRRTARLAVRDPVTEGCGYHRSKEPDGHLGREPADQFDLATDHGAPPSLLDGHARGIVVQRFYPNLELRCLIRLPIRRPPLQNDALAGLPGYDPADDSLAVDQSAVRSRFEPDPAPPQGRSQVLDENIERGAGVQGRIHAHANGSGLVAHDACLL